MKYILGLAIISAATFMVMKANAFVENLGTVEWAEQHLSTEGGSAMFYRLLGIAIIILTFMFMAGVFNRLLIGIFGGVLGS